MQGMRTLTKKDLIELVDTAFPDAKEMEAVASFFYCSEGCDKPQSQCILLHKEIDNP